MTKIKNFSQQKPILFSLVVCLISFLLLKGSGQLFSLFPDNALFEILSELFSILWPVVLTFLFGFSFIYGEKGFGATLKAGLAPFIFYIFSIITFALNAVLVTKAQWQTPMIIIIGILTLFGIGIREEVIFRGIITNTLALKYGTTKKGIWITVIASALFFGCVHFTNVLSGVELIGLTAQVIGAIGFGFLSAAIYLRGGNIWVLILIHALADASSLFGPLFTVTAMTEVDQVSSSSLAGSLIMLCVDIGLSLFLLRKSKHPAIFERLEQLRTKVK